MFNNNIINNKNMKKLILVLFILWNVFSNVWAFDIKTLWTINSSIIDKVWVLNNQEKTQIEQKIEELRTKYTTEILTIIIDSTYWEDISSIATDIWQKIWVWKSDKDNWVVILIAINDRTWNIATGYWVEWVLPDILTNRIWENNFILFKEKKYKDWIIWALNDFDKAFSWDTSIISSQKNIDETTWNIFIFQFVIALLLSSFILKPMVNDNKYKKVFLYLLIAYIITLPLAYIAVKTTFFILQNAVIWLMWFIFWVFWKSGNFGSWKWWWSSRWWGFGWFWWWGFGWWWSSWKW